MGTSGILNVVCHGAIAFVMQADGSIDLWMPDVDQSWNHNWQAGTWAFERLHSLAGGRDYQLTGVKDGDGRQRFNADLDLIRTMDPPRVPRGLRNLRTLHLPKPRDIHASNTIPFSASQSFYKPDAVPEAVKALKQMALLHTISYECDDLESVRIVASRSGSILPWRPRVLLGVKPAAVNLHIFAEPRTFGPRIEGKPVRGSAPFNVLVGALKGASPFRMKVGRKDAVSIADIRPGTPVPGLPENQKLALSQLAHFQDSGVLNQYNRPYNCGALVTQPHFAMAATSAPKTAGAGRAFAILQSKTPKVLAKPQIALIHWGMAAPDHRVETTVRKMIGLPFVTGALEEYGVSAPQWFGSFVNPKGGQGKIWDDRGVPAKATRGISSALRTLIADGKLPHPQTNPNLLYLIVPGGTTASAIPGVLGAHNCFYLEPKHTPVRYAWALRGSNGAASLQTLTRTLSHELLEACTDPEPPTGYVFEGAEICDIAMGLSTTVDGIEVAGYFSYKDGACKP